MKGLGKKTRCSRTGDCHPGMLVLLGATVALLSATGVPPSWAAAVELDEAFLRIEINATDGDVGFHGKLDGEAWKEMEIKSPKGTEIFNLEAGGALRRQGITENFFESAEPSCGDQPLRAFLRRFPAGTYKFRGKTIEGESLKGEAELSHALPAAPDISGFDGSQFEPGDLVKITWVQGHDLGNCHDQTLVDDGTIPDPASVPVDGWEVAVEPDENELEASGLPLRVFTIQLLTGQMTATVPPEYLQQYVSAGIVTFKFEVGAQAGPNQTFSEGSFTVVEPRP
jgi:hypothetical protein